jgi:Dolichyl-phosphate-mannose-protein mannosyltransferase
VRKGLLIAACLAIGLAGLVWLIGGIDARVASLAVRARDPLRPLIFGLVLLVTQIALSRDPWSRGTERVAVWFSRRAAIIAVALAFLLTTVAVYYGSFAAGGSDSYGYLSQAYGWARRELPRPIPLALTFSGPESDALQTPLAHRAGRQAHTIVPIIAPGLPLLMAALLTFGACGPYLVVPICAGLMVWMVFLWGRRTAGPMAGVISALVIAVTPVVLYQSVNPMADVPAGAMWTSAAALSLSRTKRDALLAGCCAALGLLIRPNLLPLTAVPLMTIVLRRQGRERWVHAALFCLAVLPVLLFVGAVNNEWYGSPLRSGYGTAAEVYSLANIRPNLWRYPSWMWQSQAGWTLLALLPLMPVLRRHSDNSAVLAAIMVMLTTFACYVAYAPFEAWWFLRFLLPGLGAFAVLIGAGAVAVARTLPQPWGRLVAISAVLLLAIKSITFASAAGVFGGLQAAESRYMTVGDFAARTLPGNAVVFAMQHSGSMRFYGGRYTLRYDQIESAPRVLAELTRAGLHAYMVVDDMERASAGRYFELPQGVDLPWPIVARMRELGGVTIYDLAAGPGAIQPVALEPDTRHQCIPSREGDIATGERAAPR